MKSKSLSLITRLAVLLLVLLLVPALVNRGQAAPVLNAVDPECYEHGDVNGDGVVDSRDAVQILYHSVFDDDTVTYPVNQDCDFDGDGKVDGKDAIYVLYGSFQMKQYPLEGQIHQYYAPEWVWTDADTVQVNFKCGCGQTHSYTQDAGITIERKQIAEATCLASGEVQYTATVIFDDEPITDTYVQVIPANGHQMTGTADCDSASTCANCDYTVAALGHNWVVDAENSRAATCQSHAVEAFKCSVCGDTKTNTLEGMERHNYVYVEDEEIASCVKAKLYRCDSCGDEMNGDTYTTHTYVASIETEATCAAEGVKKYSCSLCSDSYTEAIPTNDSHTWDDGVTAEGITTYTCQGCGTTKTAVVAQGNTATISKETLQDTEVQVNEAAIRLDEQTLEELGEEVKIDVEVKSAEDVVLDEELKAQIGENPVYDFSLSSDNSQVSQFAGSITISLPYTLQEGDDVDCIDVWFINDNGEVECVMGTYSNGQVTFTTDHFSYYTVTRLTPKQRCEHYGHLFTYSYKAATCTANGHDIQTCKCCGHVEKDEVLPMLEHKFIETVQKATCTEDGYTTKKCPVCKLTVSGVLPALGHNWELDEERSEEANCNQAGYETYACTGCGESYRNDLAQLEHIFETEEDKKADCSNHGHKKDRCILCNVKRDKVTDAPTGHDFTAENAVWQWEEDYSGATVTLVCAYNDKHTKTLTAVVGREIDEGNVCSDKITYKAVASFNKAEFVDYKVVDLGMVSHTPGLAWIYNDNQHYHECQVCKERVDVSKHIWDEGTVITEPTCAEEGLREFKCSVCGAKRQEAISATGKHVYVDNVCTGCGLVENTCDHYPMNHIITIDNEKWGICEDTVIEFFTCDCGEYTRFSRREGCVSKYMGTETVVTKLGEFELDVYECIYCGLTNVFGQYEELDEESCTTTWYYVYELYMDGERIAIDYNLMSGDGKPVEEQHKQSNVEYINLSEYGMCGDKVMKTSCACGENTNMYLNGTECNWEFKEIGVDACSICGAERTVVFNSVTEGCQWNNSRSYTYELDGQEVYSFVTRWGGMSCENEIVDVEYVDGSCENGAIVYYECVNCGEESYEIWGGSHPPVYREEITVEGENICSNQLIYKKCPCGQEEYIDYVTNCRFFIMESNDDNTYQRQVCTSCGLTRIVERYYSEKDENCNCYEIVKYTYIDTQDNVLLEKEARTYGEFHDIHMVHELVEGATSCEDGVEFTELCKDCGLIIDNYTYNEHRSHAVSTRYKCADYGMCGDVMVLNQCACGETSGVGTQEFRCNWEYNYTPETGMFYRCNTCNTVRSYDRYMVSENGCEQTWSSDTIYTQDGEEVLRIKAPYKQYNHRRSYYTFELLGNSCADGYRLYEHCEDCDYYYDHGVQYNQEHGTYVVDRKTISQGKLCGDLEEVTTSCACGQAKSICLEFQNGSCSYDNDGIYIPSLDAYVQKCTKCGVEQIRKEVTQPGATECETLINTTYTYRKNGANLFTHMIRNMQSNHEFLYSFDMQGRYCDEGYSVTGICHKCGHSESWGGYYGCRTWLNDTQTLELDEGSCGDVEIQKYSCPCGENSYNSFNETCSFDWQSSENGTAHWKCWNCGLDKYVSYENEVVPNSCERKTISTYQYLRNGEEVAQYVDEDIYYQHIYVATFEMDGETCADGYAYTEACMYCGKVNNTGYTYGCTGYMTEIVDLTQMGMCSGYFYKYSCPCGEMETWYLYPNCADMDSGCSYCGSSYKVTKETKRDPENCRVAVTTVYTFYRDGEVFYTFADEQWETMHDEEVTFKLHDPKGNCEDGIDLTSTCKTCGYTYSYTSYSHTSVTKDYLFFEDMDEEICSGYLVSEQCACGREKTVDTSYMTCDFQYVGYHTFSDEQGNYIDGELYQCQTCGLERLEYFYGVPDTDNCMVREYRKSIYSKNAEVIAEVERLYTWYEEHNFIDVKYEVVDEPKGCYGGVLKTSTCQCGYVEEDWIYYHETYILETIDLTQYGLCSGTLVYNACPCGEMSNWNVYDSCGGCEICGLTFNQVQSNRFDQETCAIISTTAYQISRGDEIVFEETVEVITGYRHIYVATFELIGETCQDGYYYNYTCANCGAQGDSGYDCHNHSYYTTEIVETPMYDQSSEYHIRKESCPCGEYVRWNMAPYPGEYTRSSEVRYDTETCRKITTEIYTFMENGEVIDTITCESAETWHEYVAEFELYDPKAGCEGGYAVTMTCRNCDETYYDDGYDHNTYVVDYQYVNDLDEELCGGYLYFMECACGQQKSAGENLACVGWTYVGDDEIPGGEYGSIYRCDDCGLERGNYNFSAIDEDNCQENHYQKTIYFKDGNVIMEYDSLNYSNEHHINNTTFRLFDPAVGCDAGYEVTNTCRVCGMSESWTDTGHCAYTVDYLFLDQLEGDLCGGVVEKLTCPCGFIQDLGFDNASCSFNWTTEEKQHIDPQGNSYSVAVYTCEKCGLERCEGYYNIHDRENCTGYGCCREFCRLGEEILLEAVGTTGSWDYHTWDDIQYTLLEGATSCDDGVEEKRICKYCDYSKTYINYYHTLVPVETIDLQQYGAVCDTQFVRKQCACGQSRSTEFVGEDACEMQQEWIESWITDAVVGSQDTSEGWVELGNDAWCYTCAVTDPQCAFKVRNARYYKVENCVATQYETWQFGYNPEDGSCAYEFTFATGDQRAFHDYEYVYEYRQVDETTYMYVNTYTCAACNSTCTETNTYVDGYPYSSEIVAVNTLNNGENQYRRNYYENGFRYKDYTYTTLDLHQYTYADGREYWHRYDYTYDFTIGCNCTNVYTDSNGEYNSYEGTCHSTHWVSETTKDATCTQFGEFKEGWFCIACDWVESGGVIQHEPTDHFWAPDPDNNGSVCMTCGLRNANGASGSIVMEDMSESYGEGFNYVVGYWNRYGMSVHKYVSVVLEDAAEGEEDELILDDIFFTELTAENDGITAISFSQADALAKAQAAMEAAGYTGDYAIRFTFVPTDAGDTLDYAITFDALSV